MNQEPAKLIIPITGMHCASCAARIEKALNQLTGVAEAVVNFAFQQARVEYSPQQLSPEDIYAAVERAGYGVKREALPPAEEADDEARLLRQARIRLLVASRMMLRLPLLRLSA